MTTTESSPAPASGAGAFPVRRARWVAAAALLAYVVYAAHAKPFEVRQHVVLLDGGSRTESSSPLDGAPAGGPIRIRIEVENRTDAAMSQVRVGAVIVDADGASHGLLQLTSGDTLSARSTRVYEASLPRRGPERAVLGLWTRAVDGHGRPTGVAACHPLCVGCNDTATAACDHFSRNQGRLK